MNTPQKLRWRVVLGIPILLFGGLTLLGWIWVLGFMVYMNIRHGWITVHPEPQALNNLAFTPGNLFGVFWRIALSATLVWWGLRLVRSRSLKPNGMTSLPTTPG